MSLQNRCMLCERTQEAKQQKKTNLPVSPSSSSRQWGSENLPLGVMALYTWHASAGGKATCSTQNLGNNALDHTNPTGRTCLQEKSSQRSTSTQIPQALEGLLECSSAGFSKRLLLVPREERKLL